MIENALAMALSALVSSVPGGLFPLPSVPPDLSTMEVVERVNAILLSAPEMNNWQARVLSTILEMDKNWQPKKKIIVEKLTSVENEKKTEKILSATEHEGDKTRNVTAQYQAEAAKFRESHGSGEEEGGKRKGGRHRGLNLSHDEMFPFSEEKRKGYDFELNDGTLIDGQRIYALETRPKQKSSEFYEGTYSIHPETFDILRAKLRPAEMPGPLKLLEIDIGFERLPGGHLAVRTAKARVHVGLIIKNIRMETEEVYSEYVVLD
jgi:hypothetical protein